MRERSIRELAGIVEYALQIIRRQSLDKGMQLFGNSRHSASFLLICQRRQHVLAFQILVVAEDLVNGHA